MIGTNQGRNKHKMIYQTIFVSQTEIYRTIITLHCVINISRYRSIRVQFGLIAHRLSNKEFLKSNTKVVLTL